MSEQIIYSSFTLDELTERVAEKVISKLACTTAGEKTSQSSSEDILFKSVQEAADYYGVCYQTISKHLDKIPHLTFGRAIRIYKSAIEEAILRHNLFSRKGGKR